MYSNRFYEAAMSQNISKHVEHTWGLLSLDGLGWPHNTGQHDTPSAGGWSSKKQNLQKVRSSVRFRAQEIKEWFTERKETGFWKDQISLKEYDWEEEWKADAMIRERSSLERHGNPQRFSHIKEKTSSRNLHKVELDWRYAVCDSVETNSLSLSVSSYRISLRLHYYQTLL